MEVGRDEFQTGAEAEAKITERGKNFGENIGDDHDVLKRNSYPI
jgi:hypothetical protein